MNTNQNADSTTLETARDRSRLVRATRRCVRNVRTAAIRSRVAAIVRSLSSGDSNGSDGIAVETRLESIDRYRRGSALRRRLGPTRTRLARAVERARVASVAAAVGRYATASRGYRWLTAEPDPDVVVIDLRETRSVGPAISLLDRAIDVLAATVPRSSVGRGLESLAASVRARPIRAASLAALSGILASLVVLAGTTTVTTPLLGAHLGLGALAGIGVRSRRTLEDVRESRIVSALAAAFEPPEPPR